MEQFKPVKLIENQETAPNLQFNEEKATLLLKVTPSTDSLNKTKKYAEREGLSEKKEFHTTLIGFDSGKIILEKINSLHRPKEETEKILIKIKELFESYKWSYEFLDDFYKIDRKYDYDNKMSEKRSSIIETINLPDLENFYKKLNEIIDAEIPLPFPHITLYTNSIDKKYELSGIGINSKDQFVEMNPEKLIT